jgi:glycine betaine/proline transport system substrate-binding protein
VVTAYSPHWVHAKFKLRYLEDPQKRMLEPDGVHALARLGFGGAFPQATQFLRQFRMPIEDVEGILFRATSVVMGDAIDEYLAHHPERIEAWTQGIK